MEAFQLFIIAFPIILPFALLAGREPWQDDRLTFRGRPTPRDWRRQVEPTVPGDDHH